MRRVAWSKLDGSIQQRLADRAARRLSERIGDWGPGVRGVLVGRGYRESATQRAKPGTRICFLVDKKLKRVRRPRVALPSKVEVRFRHRGRMATTAIPTDVEDMARAEDQQGDCAIVARRRPPPNQPLDGAATCLVRDEDGAPYVLGCHHVIAFSSATAGGHGLNDVRIHDAADVRVAGLRWKAPFPAPHATGIDAALAAVNGAQELARLRQQHWPLGIRGVARRTGPRYRNGSRVRIRLPGGTALSGEINGFSRGPLVYAYRAGFRVAIENTFRIRTHGGATAGGDSGSPVVTADDVLIGMHFYGNPARQHSFMIPTFVLFRTDTFGFQIRPDLPRRS